MLPIHERMAELWTIRSRRELTGEEWRELTFCLDANASYVWKKVKVNNLCQLASMTNDSHWLQELGQKKPDS